MLFILAFCRFLCKSSKYLHIRHFTTGTIAESQVLDANTPIHVHCTCNYKNHDKSACLSRTLAGCDTQLQFADTKRTVVRRV